MIGRMTLDGVALNDPAGRWHLSDDTRLGTMPGTSLSAASIPGRHGSIPAPPRVYGAGSAAVGLIVTDNNAAGNVTGQHQQVLDNLAALYRLAAPLGRLPVLAHYPYAVLDTRREASVRLLAGVEPEWPDIYTARVVFPFDIPGVFWREPAPLRVLSVALDTWTVASSALDGSTAPIVDPVISLAGPLTYVTITSGGSTLHWLGNVPAGRWLVIRPDTYEAVIATAEGAATGTNAAVYLTTPPDGFALTPSATGAVGWEVRRTGGAGVNVITARRAFL